MIAIDVIYLSNNQILSCKNLLRKGKEVGYRENNLNYGDGRQDQYRQVLYRQKTEGKFREVKYDLSASIGGFFGSC
jgi:hypothetical protein